MATADEIKNFQRLQSGAVEALSIPPIPQLPPDVKQRFPSLVDWEQKMQDWRVKANIVIRGGQG